MEQQSYNCIITANLTPNEAFNAINSVAKWWSENIDGSTENLNDVFTIHFGDAWTSYKIVEFVKDKKVVWLVTDCELTWLKDKSLADLDNLPDPDILANEIIENMEASLQSFKEIMLTINGESER